MCGDENTGISMSIEKTMERGRAEAALDSVRHDNDIDLDRVRTRTQLGFRDGPQGGDSAPGAAPSGGRMEMLAEAARAEAGRRNGLLWGASGGAAAKEAEAEL